MESNKQPEIIPYNAADHYDLVHQWWSHYNGEPFPVECLPDTGVIALNGTKPAAVMFMYTTNSKMVWLHFAMADPELGAGRRVDFVRAAVAAAIDMAKAHLNGQGHIWCCTDSAVVARIYAENKMECPGEADVYFLPVGKQSTEFMK